MKTSILIGLLIFISASCTAPRTVNVSGKVVPKGNVIAGVSYTANLPTRTAALMGDVVTGNLKDIANRDSITFDKNVERVNKAAIAYATDPIGSGFDFYIRYGIVKRLEAGYKLAGIAHAFSAQYQFLGPTGKVGTENGYKWYGSAGLQYGWQNFKMPGVLADVQDVMNYSFKRKDILVPVIFSHSLGNEEEYGSIAFGVAYSYTRLTYTTVPKRFFDANGLPVLGMMNKKAFSAFGGFVNVKAGYKYIYIIPALAFYYQNYGTYKLLDGSAFSFDGFTFVPSVSVQVRLGK